MHSQHHVHFIKRDSLLYEIACLSAGGAILAAELAMKGEPTFGLARPPGHHASPGHSWGFCFFNNIAIALVKLQAENRIQRALILDFDLHFGDGTSNIFAESQIRYFHPRSQNRQDFIDSIKKRLEEEKDYQILAVSAGFDRGIEDWGGMLLPEDYQTIGRFSRSQ